MNVVGNVARTMDLKLAETRRRESERGPFKDVVEGYWISECNKKRLVSMEDPLQIDSWVASKHGQRGTLRVARARPWRVGVWLWHEECGGFNKGKGGSEERPTSKGDETETPIGRINELTCPAERKRIDCGEG